MKIRVFAAMSEGGLEKKVNDFILTSGIEIIDIQFAAHIFGYAVMIRYKPERT